jgi:hypothetical protein
MKKWSLVLVLLIMACNDGDIITEDLVFGDTFEACGELVLYKINTSPNESLSFQITSPPITIDDLLLTEPASDTNPPIVTLVNENPSTIAIGSSNILNYRSYDSAPNNLFCNDVPPTNISISQDFTSSSGEAAFTISLLEDDNDGIPAEFEDLNGDGDLTNDDTDGDGLPNYLDPDDDNDNVPTASEMVNFDISLANPFENTLDTDNDGTPNYLDNDDDDDGILTINEESLTQNLNPTDDITNATVGPDYLNFAEDASVSTTEYIDHIINQEFTVKLKFFNVSFPTIQYDELDFGTLNSSLTTKTRVFKPVF